MIRDDTWRRVRDEVDRPAECRRVNGISPTGHPRLGRDGL